MPSIVNNPIVNYFREAKVELEKIAWPTKKDTLLYSGTVIVLCLTMAVYFGALDWALNKGLEALVHLVNG
jgi:preprotein translocase subunit SecE